MGLAMVHQELQPIPERTMAENMYAGKVINKNPAIKNNSKNDAYLRMTVSIPLLLV